MPSYANDLCYQDVVMRMKGYARLRRQGLEKVYKMVVPKSWQIDKPSRERMLKQLYKYLMREVVTPDIERLLAWYYSRTHGGKAIPFTTYLLARRYLGMIFAVLSPSADGLCFDPELSKLIRDINPRYQAIDRVAICLDQTE